MPKSDTQWKPGQSGNPKGRPKNPYLEAIKKRIPPGVLAEAILRGVERDDPQCIKYAGDRILGTPRQTIDQTVYQTDNAVLDALNEMQAKWDADKSTST